MKAETTVESTSAISIEETGLSARRLGRRPSSGAKGGDPVEGAYNGRKEAKEAKKRQLGHRVSHLRGVRAAAFPDGGSTRPRSGRPAVRTTLDAAQAAYAEDLGRRGLSPHTLKRYTNEVEQILRFLRGQGLTHLEDVGREHVQAFRDHLYFLKSRSHKAPLTAASQRLILTQVIIFFRHFLRQRLLVRNPAVSLILPRQEIKISRNYLRPDEMERLLSVVDVRTLFGLQDRTVFEVAYASGLRVNELLSAEVSDFKAADSLLLVRHAKGGQERVVPLTPIACHFLAFWLAGPREAMLAGRGSLLLFPAESGRKQRLIYYRKRFRTYGLLADIAHRLSFHVFRRSVATHLLQNGADVRHIQRLLGHNSIDTTLRYLQTTTHDLREVLVRHHPREKWWRQRHPQPATEAPSA